MDYSKLNLFKMMKTRMDYLNERQGKLAENIANADVPGYKPTDLRKLDFESMALTEAHRVQMRTTNAFHMEPKQKQAHFREIKQKKTYETTPMKNSVVIEEQMMKVAETKLEYEKTANLYQKTSELFKTAIGSSN